MRVKKLLSVQTILGIVCLGVLGALAVIPHTHGNDLNHSHHKDCPVYQFGLGHTAADSSVVNVIIALFLFSYLVAFQKTLPIIVSGKISLLRGPPDRR